VLSFPYNHDNQKVEIDYLRVRKSDSQTRRFVLFHIYLTEVPICPVSAGNHKEMNGSFSGGSS
jgi:hypothetical protein